MIKKGFSIAVMLFVLIVAEGGFEYLAARSYEKAPVITYMRKGSYRAKYIIGINVYENGRVSLFDKANIKGRRNIIISKDRIRYLLDFIVNKNDFFSITGDDFKAFQKSRSIRKDASMTYVTVRWNGKVHTLSLYDFSRNTRVSTPKMKRLKNIVIELDELLRETMKK